MSSSSSSYLRPSAIWAVFISQPGPSQTRTWSPAQVAQLAVDLGLDIERRLSLASASLVARDDQLADLLAERGVRTATRRRAREGVDLGVDVERGLPAGLAPRRLGLDQLADLRARLRVGGGAPGGGARRR